MLKKILPIIEEVPHITYVEPFGGSAAILLNKSPSPVEVYNDLYGDVVNFFRVLRDKKEVLVEKLRLTPYSREEYVESLNRDQDTDIERARKFFVTARQVMMGVATTATPGRWSVAHKQSRRGMALVVSRYLSAIEKLPEVIERLRTVIIENDIATNIIRKYDGPETLYYLDPPYPMDTRSGGKGYCYEMTIESHAELLDLIVGLQAKVAISSYHNSLYEQKLKSWTCTTFDVLANTANGRGTDSKRKEFLWTNF